MRLAPERLMSSSRLRLENAKRLSSVTCEQAYNRNSLICSQDWTDTRPRGLKLMHLQSDGHMRIKKQIFKRYFRSSLHQADLVPSPRIQDKIEIVISPNSSIVASQLVRTHHLALKQVEFGRKESGDLKGWWVACLVRLSVMRPVQMLVSIFRPWSPMNLQPLKFKCWSLLLYVAKDSNAASLTASTQYNSSLLRSFMVDVKSVIAFSDNLQSSDINVLWDLETGVLWPLGVYDVFAKVPANFTCQLDWHLLDWYCYEASECRVRNTSDTDQLYSLQLQKSCWEMYVAMTETVMHTSLLK